MLTCSNVGLGFRQKEWQDEPVGGQSSIMEQTEELTGANVLRALGV